MGHPSSTRAIRRNLLRSESRRAEIQASHRSYVKYGAAVGFFSSLLMWGGALLAAQETVKYSIQSELPNFDARNCTVSGTPSCNFMTNCGNATFVATLDVIGPAACKEITGLFLKVFLPIAGVAGPVLGGLFGSKKFANATNVEANQPARTAVAPISIRAPKRPTQVELTSVGYGTFPKSPRNS